MNLDIACLFLQEQMQINSHVNPPENGGCLMSTPNLVSVTDASNTEQCTQITSLVEANSLTCTPDKSPQEPNTDDFQQDANELCKEQEFGSGEPQKQWFSVELEGINS